MEYRRLGRSGLQVSSLVLGTMNFGNPTAREDAIGIVDAAIDGGINLIDCADIYARGDSERILGEAFQRNKKRRFQNFERRSACRVYCQSRSKRSAS